MIVVGQLLLLNGQMSVCVECRIQNNIVYRDIQIFICDKSSCYPTFSSKMRLPPCPVDQKISDKVTILGGCNPIIGLMVDSKDGDWWTGTLRQKHCGNSGARINIKARYLEFIPMPSKDVFIICQIGHKQHFIAPEQ